jgi:hypothetical protein
MSAFRKTRGWPLLLMGAMGALAGCGGSDFENDPRPPVAIELTGVIQARGVSVSPAKVGAGPILITISNQTGEAHTVTLESSGDSSVDEQVGPIAPQDTATIQKTVAPGPYQVRAGSAAAVKKPIPPAELTVGPKRVSSSDKVLLP